MKYWKYKHNIQVAVIDFLLERNAFSEVSQILRAEHFYVEAHQLIFKAIQNLEKKSWQCDLMTVVDELTRDVDRIGGWGSNGFN